MISQKDLCDDIIMQDAPSDTHIEALRQDYRLSGCHRRAGLLLRRLLTLLARRRHLRWDYRLR